MICFWSWFSLTMLWTFFLWSFSSDLFDSFLFDSLFGWSWQVDCWGCSDWWWSLRKDRINTSSDRLWINWCSVNVISFLLSDQSIFHLVLLYRLTFLLSAESNKHTQNHDNSNTNDDDSQNFLLFLNIFFFGEIDVNHKGVVGEGIECGYCNLISWCCSVCYCQCHILVERYLCDVCSCHIAPKEFVFSKVVEIVGCLVNVLDWMTTKCSYHWYQSVI